MIGMQVDVKLGSKRADGKVRVREERVEGDKVETGSNYISYLHTHKKLYITVVVCFQLLW